MIDPTQMNQALARKQKKSDAPGYYGMTFLYGLLGGLIGGAVFLVLQWRAHLISFPVLILSGIGTVAIYLYFMEEERRNNRQLAFLFLAGLADTLLLMFFFTLLSLHMVGAPITFRNISGAYFHSTVAAVFGSFSYVLFYHIAAYFFIALGIGLVWLYLKISVPRWEAKHGKQAGAGQGFRARTKRRKSR